MLIKDLHGRTWQAVGRLEAGSAESKHEQYEPTANGRTFDSSVLEDRGRQQGLETEVICAAAYTALLPLPFCQAKTLW